MPFERGQVLSYYEILAPLGAGGMGEVYRARDTRLDREVAIKVLSDHLSEEAEPLMRFEREAKALASLSHPNIAQVYGIDQVGDVCFIVLELVDGEDLELRLKRGALPVREALAIGRQIAEGLQAAHAAGVVHRDLKPANVVLALDGRAKLVDFGLAKRLCFESATQAQACTGSVDSGLTGDGRLLGTIDYMSPEQSRGREVDECTDIWAFGCLLYELLAGTRIFPADSVADKLAAIAADTPDWSALPTATPQSVRRLLERCLEKDAAQRPASFEEVRQALSGAEAAPETQSIAVLPFANSSSDPDDEYFSDGITDEILNALNGLPNLSVAARTSSFALRERALDVSEIGTSLGVTCVLEGSVRRAGDRVRISVRLVEVAGGYQVWSERFDCKLGDIFDLQDRVASQVAAALSVELGPAPEERLVPRRTGDPEAYDRYLQGRFLLGQRGSALEQAAKVFQTAIDLDPEFAAAHAGLAEAWGLTSLYGSRRPHERMPRAREAAERALELDPNVAEAHTALGWVRLTYDWDAAAAGREFQAALRLDPRAVQARLWHGAYVLTLVEGKPDEGIALCREATEIDPLSGSALGQLAVAQNFAGRERDALATIQRTIEAETTSYMIWFHRGLAHFNLGEYEAAQRDLERAASLTSMNVWARSLLAATYAKKGETRCAEALQRALVHDDETGYVSPACLALTPAVLGRTDRAFAHLEDAIRERDGIMRTLPIWRALDPLREDPRFADLLERANLA